MNVEMKPENQETPEEKYEKQRETFEKRLIIMYEAGETTYLDVLLSSKSITDFVASSHCWLSLFDLEYD